MESKGELILFLLVFAGSVHAMLYFTKDIFMRNIPQKKYAVALGEIAALILVCCIALRLVYPAIYDGDDINGSSLIVGVITYGLLGLFTCFNALGKIKQKK